MTSTGSSRRRVPTFNLMGVRPGTVGIKYLLRTTWLLTLYYSVPLLPWEQFSSGKGLGLFLWLRGPKVQFKGSFLSCVLRGPFVRRNTPNDLRVTSPSLDPPEVRRTYVSRTRAVFNVGEWSYTDWDLLRLVYEETGGVGRNLFDENRFRNIHQFGCPFGSHVFRVSLLLRPAPTSRGRGRVRTVPRDNRDNLYSVRLALK